MTLLQISNNFFTKLKQTSKEVATLIMNRKTGVSVYTDDVLDKYMTPIFDDLFSDGRKASVSLIKKDLLKYTKKYDVPLKYNKDVLSAINSESIFTGYYDKKYADIYTKTEINNLKKTILQAKYSGLSEQQLTTNILNTVKTTKNKALQLARYETNRLRAATQSEYLKVPKIKKKYDKKFVSEDDARDSHKAYNGQIADEDGLFHGPLGSFEFPPIPGQYGCRCKVVFVKK